MKNINKSEYFITREIVRENDRTYYKEVVTKKELRWRIVFGYNTTDYISIGEEDIEKAKYAWITKSIFNHPIKPINGSEIKRIEPDWRYYSGWRDGYEPKAPEDYRDIQASIPTHLIEDRTKLADVRIATVLQKNEPSLLNNLSEVDKLLTGVDRELLESRNAQRAIDTSALIKKMKI